MLTSAPVSNLNSIDTCNMQNNLQFLFTTAVKQIDCNYLLRIYNSSFANSYFPDFYRFFLWLDKLRNVFDHNWYILKSACSKLLVEEQSNLTDFWAIFL